MIVADSCSLSYPRFILCKSKLVELSVLSHWVTHILNRDRRWEVPIEAVILDGQLLPVSNLSGSGSGLSALLDTVITV